MVVCLFVDIQIYNKFSGFLLFFTIIYNLSLEMSDEPIFSLFFSIDVLHFPTVVGTEGLFIACESWENDHKSHLWQGNGNIAKQRTEKQNRNAIAMPWKRDPQKNMAILWINKNFSISLHIERTEKSEPERCGAGRIATSADFKPQ